MASASVVGQPPGPHMLDSEPVLLLKLKKITLPRKSSWEKMMSRRSSGSSGESGSVSAEGESRSQPLSPGPAGGTAVRGGMIPGEGCGAPGAPAAPRSPDRDRREGGTDCDRHTTAGTRQCRTGTITGDCNSNGDCDSNHSIGVRRGSSHKRSGINVMSGGSITNGHKGSHRHRDSLHKRRDTRSGDGGHQSASPQTQADNSGLQLERVTQGRTGVVRLARTEPHRMEAWSIFPEGQDPRVKTERGEGHRFETKSVTQDWCDSCRRQITVQSRKCQNCSYTCHLECENQVQLDCNQRDREPEQAPSPRGHSSSTAAQQKQNEAKEEEEGGTKALSEEEARTRIEEYNAQVQVSENGMKLASDGTYTGFIKVHLRLNRPVTVPAVEAVVGQTGSSSQAASDYQEGADCGTSEKRTSFYLPCDCVKQIHISSLTTTREVIQGLLKKFMVLDNPRKFALYRQTHRDGQDLFQKLPLNEHPLLLRLIAGPDPEQLSFVLKENETGEVEYHAFSVPELQNFLVILQKEEAERVRAVEQKYTLYRQKLQQALKRHDP